LFYSPLRGNHNAQQLFLAQSTHPIQAELELIRIKGSFPDDLSLRHSDLARTHTVLVASHDKVSLRKTLFDNERQRHQLSVGLLGNVI
jgi:hypothetical protein